MLCPYYQATIQKNMIWFVTATIRTEDHWVFDRTVDGTSNVLEFFVAPDFEPEFLSRMRYFEGLGYVTKLEKLPNRFSDTAP